MASNKTGMTGAKGSGAGSGLAGVLLGMIAAGIGGGAVLIASSKAVGEKLLDKQEADELKLQAQREADKEEVRRIMENEY